MQKRIVFSFISIFLLSITMISCPIVMERTGGTKICYDYDFKLSKTEFAVNESVSLESSFGRVYEIPDDNIHLVIQSDESFSVTGENVSEEVSEDGDKVFSVVGKYNSEDHYYYAECNISFSTSGDKTIIYNWKDMYNNYLYKYSDYKQIVSVVEN